MRPVGSKYLLEEPLGRGASGTVWLGRTRDTDEPVAIKVLREELAADPDVVARFVRERSLLLRVRHQHLVRVRDLVVEGELLALVMDLVDGPDLRVHLREHGPMSPAESAFLLAQVVAALAAAHATGIVHRDLKPGNVLLAAKDGAPHALLTDFGIARLAEGPKITRTHEFLGTPAYLAPETALGLPPTPAIDVYAVGIVLCELVTGDVPFQDSNPLVVLRQHIEERPAQPAEMPPALWSVAEACLAKDPASRPTTQALAPWLDQLAGSLGSGRPGVWPGAMWSAPPPRTRSTATTPLAKPGVRGVATAQRAEAAGFATGPSNAPTEPVARPDWQAAAANPAPVLPDSYFRPGGGGSGPGGTRVFPGHPDAGQGDGYPPPPPVPATQQPPAGMVWPRHEVIEPEPARYRPAREPEPRRAPRPEPRPARASRGPRLRWWRVPGMGCLLRLVVLVVVGAVLWHVFGVSARVHQTATWFHQIAADLQAVKSWFSNLGGLLR